MRLLTPLGLLGLISIIVWIIIYIIKPNFQQKFISSTYIWKLSLKYKKKKIPVSTLRNILLIICQILILLGSTFILAKPVTVTETPTDNREVIAVIDSSASMRATADGETRFVRSLNQVLDLSQQVFENGGTMSVIIADEKPYFLAQRVGADNKETLENALDSLLKDEEACSYAVADMKTAMDLCETIIDENAEAQVYLYTDTTYDYVPEKVKLQTDVVRGEEEWNLAILNAYTDFDDNYYSLTVDIACYGWNMDVKVNVDIHNANPDYETNEGRTISLDTSNIDKITCSDDKITRIVFINSDLYQPGLSSEEDVNLFFYPLSLDEQFYSYDDILISVSPADKNQPGADSLVTDNTFSLYGGQKEVLKIQYSSTMPNKFFGGVLTALRTNLKDWDIQITEVKEGEEGVTEGFDFYIYEHTAPTTMPSDGIVLLSDPTSSPSGSGMRIVQFEKGWNNGYSLNLSEENGEHPLLKSMSGENITVSQYTEVSLDPMYEMLFSLDGDPLLAVKNEIDAKVIVMPFSMHYSNLSLLKEFPLLMVNIIRYFLPATVAENNYEINETVMMQLRGESLTLKTNTDVVLKEFTENPASYTFTTPGTYVLSQSQFLGNDVPDQKLFIRIPQTESNIMAHEETLDNPYQSDVVLVHYDDWLFYIAIAIVALLFIEWWLQSRENM